MAGVAPIGLELDRRDELSLLEQAEEPAEIARRIHAGQLVEQVEAVDACSRGAVETRGAEGDHLVRGSGLEVDDEPSPRDVLDRRREGRPSDSVDREVELNTA